jgi:hypothetical protein
LSSRAHWLIAAAARKPRIGADLRKPAVTRPRRRARFSNPSVVRQSAGLNLLASATRSDLTENTMTFTHVLINWLEQRYLKKLDNYLARLDGLHRQEYADSK